MHERRWMVVVIACLASACGSATAERSSEEGEPRGKSEREVPRVVVVEPGVSDAEQDVKLPGGLEGFESARLFARVTGYLETVSVDIGQEVDEGDVLARIVMPEVRSELALARARIRSKKAQVAQKEGQRDLAHVTRDRLEKLHEQQPGAVPQQDVDEAVAKAHIAEAEVDLASNDVQEAEARLQRLQTMASFATLRAPFRGRITDRVLHPGALVRAGTESGAEPIVEIVRTDPLRLTFQVPESMVAHVRTGHPVTLTFDAFPSDAVDAEVTRVAGALDSKTRYMRAEVDVPNPEGRYRPGMYAGVQLQAVTQKDALILPSRAVRGTKASRHVLVVTDGVLEKRPVTVASDDGERAVLVSGVQPDELVMLAGSPLATDGTRVDPVLEEKPGDSGEEEE